MDRAPVSAEREHLLEIIEADLPRLLPDLEVVDRGLVLARGRVRTSEGRRADLVLLDPDGRALILLIVDGWDDDTVLAAIDALAYARQSGDALARGPVRIALVASTFSARVLESLALLPERELLAFETRLVESDAGSRTHLVRVEIAGSRPPPTLATRESFLAALPQALRASAEILLLRLARVDTGIACAFADDAVECACDGRVLCVLDLEAGALHGEIPALARRLPIRGMDDVDVFLDEVLREHIRGLGTGWSGEGPFAGGGRARSSEAPLLTPEEIAAFQQ
jgi:hypothetical protein